MCIPKPFSVLFCFISTKTLNLKKFRPIFF